MKKQSTKYIPFAKYLAIFKYNKQSNRILDDVIKIIGTISGATVLFASLLYIIGRNYAAGYFGAMNIPEFLLTYSAWEYGAIAWPSLLLLVSIIAVSITSVFIVQIIWSAVIAPTLNCITNWVFTIIHKEHIKNKISTGIKIFILTYRTQIIMLLVGILIGSCCYLLLISTNLQSDLGNFFGKKQLFRNTTGVEIHSTTPLVSNTGQLTYQYSNSNSYYIYNDFRLLTKNNGKYYLFKELDPETCKPKQVYIIDESKIDQVILSPAEAISDQCNEPVNVVSP